MTAVLSVDRALRFDQKGGIGLTGCIIHGDNKIALAAREPCVARAILMQHHSGQWSALTFTAVRSAPLRPHHNPLRLQALLTHV